MATISYTKTLVGAGHFIVEWLSVTPADSAVPFDVSECGATPVSVMFKEGADGGGASLNGSNESGAQSADVFLAGSGPSTSLQELLSKPCSRWLRPSVSGLGAWSIYVLFSTK